MGNVNFLRSVSGDRKAFKLSAILEGEKNKGNHKSHKEIDIAETNW